MQDLADAAMQRFIGSEADPIAGWSHLDHAHRSVGMEDHRARIAVVGGKVGEPFHIAAQPVVGVLHHDRIDAVILHDAVHRAPASR